MAILRPVNPLTDPTSYWRLQFQNLLTRLQLYGKDDALDIVAQTSATPDAFVKTRTGSGKISPALIDLDELNIVYYDGSGNVTVRFGFGSVSNPSITFNGDLDTGWYRPASGELAATIDGVRSASILSRQLKVRGATAADDVTIDAPTRSVTQGSLTTSSVSTAVTIPTSVGSIDVSPIASVRSAKYLLSITYTPTTGPVQCQVSELAMVHDGTTAYVTEYAVQFTGAAQLATFTNDISGGNMRLLAVATNGTGTTVVKYMKQVIAV